MPTLNCLQYFGPKLAAGGIFVVDDYDAVTCPGIKQAVQEYLAGAPYFQTWRLQVDQIVLIKQGATVPASAPQRGPTA
jgi:hypothetical protein